MNDERIGTVEAARIMGCSVAAARKRLRAAKVDTQKVPGLHGGVMLSFLKSDAENYVHKVREARPKVDSYIEFRDAYCRWQDDAPIEKGRTLTELHVESKTAEVRKNLTAAMESGALVMAAGRSYNQTQYRVLREVDSVFVLVNARGMA